MIGNGRGREAARGGRPCHRRSLLLPAAHFHAESLTSEHLLLLNCFLRAGRGGSPVELEELISKRRGSRERVPSCGGAAVTRAGAARTCGREGVACRGASGPRHRKKRLGRGWDRAQAAPVPASALGGAHFASRAPGWESWWTCQPRGGRRRGARGIAAPGDAARARASVTPRAGTRRRGRRSGEGRARPGDPDAQGAGRGHGGCGSRGSSRPGARGRVRVGVRDRGGHVQDLLPALDRRDGHPGESPEAGRRGKGRARAGEGGRAAPRRPGVPCARAPAWPARSSGSSFSGSSAQGVKGTRSGVSNPN